MLHITLITTFIILRYPHKRFIPGRDRCHDLVVNQMTSLSNKGCRTGNKHRWLPSRLFLEVLWPLYWSEFLVAETRIHSSLFKQQDCLWRDMGSLLNYEGGFQDGFPEPLCTTGPPTLKGLHLTKSRSCWIRKLLLWQLTVKWCYLSLGRWANAGFKRKMYLMKVMGFTLSGPNCENGQMSYFSGALLMLQSFLRIFPCSSVCFCLSANLVPPLNLNPVPRATLGLCEV